MSAAPSGLTRTSLIFAVVAASCGDSRTVSPPPPMNNTPMLESIELTPPNLTVEVGQSQKYVARGTYSDDATRELNEGLTWASSDAAVASIAADGTLTAIAEGTVSVSATLDGVSGSTMVTVIFTGLESIEVTPAESTVEIRRTQQLTATGKYGDGSTRDLTALVTWTSDDDAIATVSASGLATGVSPGAVTITAADPDSGVRATAELEVTAPPLVSIKVTPAAPSSPVGMQVQLAAMGTYADRTTRDITPEVMWISDNPTIATISSVPGSEGLATAVAAGTANISAVDPTSGLSSDASNGSAVMTVTPAVLVEIDVQPRTASVALGGSVRFTAQGKLSDNTMRDVSADVSWSSSDRRIATVSNDVATRGLATSVAVGTATIRAFHSMSGVSSEDTATSGTLAISPPALVSIAVIPQNPSIPDGATQQFASTGIYSDNSNRPLTTQVVWFSSDVSVASISNDSGTKGLATALRAGVTTISAQDPATGLSSDLSQLSSNLTVTPAAVVSVAVTPLSQQLVRTNTTPFRAFATHTDGSTSEITSVARWQSSNTNVATISNSVSSRGVATGVAVGAARISAVEPASGISSDASNASATLTVTPGALIGIAVTPAAPALPIGVSRRLIATGSYGDGSTQEVTDFVDWVSTATSVATVSNMPGGKGWVTALAAGVTTISATDPMTGISSFTTNTSARLSVNTAALRALAVSPRSPNIHLNATVQLTASGAFTDNSTHDVTQSVTWASSNVAVADVGNSGRTRGLVTGRTVGNAIISATDPATGVSSDASNESASVNVLQPYLFIEDFEDGAIPEWTAPGPGYSAMITLGGAAMTSRSLTLSGGAATGHYMAVSRQFTGIQPSQLRFHVRTDRTDLNTGYFVVGDAGIGDPVTNNQGIIFFHFSSGAAMYLYDGIAARGRTTYQPNVWHLIECRNMSWSTRTYDIWIDGVQRDVNVPFRSATTTVVERIELYNFQPGVASFDQIIME